MKLYASDEIKLGFTVTAADGRYYTPLVNIGDANWTWTVHGLSSTDLNIHGNNSRLRMPGFEGYVNPVVASLQSSTGAKINQIITDPDFEGHWVQLTDFADELIHMTISGNSAFVQGYLAVRWLRLSVDASSSGATAFFFDESKI